MYKRGLVTPNLYLDSFFRNQPSTLEGIVTEIGGDRNSLRQHYVIAVLRQRLRVPSVLYYFHHKSFQVNRRLVSTQYPSHYVRLDSGLVPSIFSFLELIDVFYFLFPDF